MRWSASLCCLMLSLAACTAAAAQDDVARLKAHFRAVEAELLSRDVAGLTPEQRQARARNIRVLREYREAGVFPHNHDFRDERRPYFVDRHGTLCAMAYLIARSGREDLVRRVAEADNHAYLPALAHDPELAAWLHAAGLTVEEAARIQPTYGYRPEKGVTRDYAHATALTMGLEGGLVAWNLAVDPGSGNRWVRGTAGIVGGVWGVLLGIASVAGAGGDPDLGLINAAAGTTSAFAGLRTLLVRGRADRDGSADAARPAAMSLTASPWSDGRGEAGLVLRLRF